jgi:hypothetical protein
MLTVLDVANLQSQIHIITVFFVKACDLALRLKHRTVHLIGDYTDISSRIYFMGSCIC